MKSKLLLLLVFLLLQKIFAQFPDKIDPYLFYLKNSLYETEIYADKVPISFNNEMIEMFGLERSDSQYNIKVIIQLNTPDLSEIRAVPFIKVNSIMEDMITAELPFESLEQLAAIKNVSFITLGKPVESFLDAADLKVRGREGRNAFGKTGQGVIIGIIDTGIDITSEDFKHANDNTRILYIWDQKDLIGPHPANFNYGTEWSATEINAGSCREIDDELHGHGTLVSGIAAGNGRATGNSQPADTYVGIAPNADIIAVKLDFSNYANIIDAISWIDSKAYALNKPWVINLSLGSKWGPRDGTSPFDKAIFGIQNNTSAKGRIIVAAVGNFGYNANDPNRKEENKIHASSENSPTTRTFRINSSNSSSDEENFFMEIWYPQNSNYSIQLKAPDAELVNRNETNILFN